MKKIRSQRRPLSRARILRAALAITDRFGVEALTMRRVADRLGVEPMSLYYHVPNKESMLDGVLDLLVEEANLPTGEVTPADWIAGSAAAVRALARTHPRTFPLFARRPAPAADPAAAAPLEAGLAAFRAAGYSSLDAFYAVQTILIALLPFGLMESYVALDGASGPVSGMDEVSADPFPVIQEVVSEVAQSLLSVEVYLDRLWDGIVTALTAGFAA